MNDREILARLEAAAPEELGGLLRRPSENEARVYRAYFGPARYDALRHKTLTTRSATGFAKRGNVVILHGIMGGELSLRDRGSDKGIWMNLFRLAFGAVDKLRMKDGKSELDVRATGILKKYYAEQILELSTEWKLQTYWYDWRLSLDELADDLHSKINGWFGEDAAVHLVAHSMGGLVSRTYIARHAKRWNKGGKLIMLGTPNHGSFAIPQVITGAIDTVRKLASLDVTHSLAEITEILGQFPGSLEMLPSPLVMPAMTRLYQSTTWGGRVPQSLLDNARRHHDALADVVDGGRMHYIAGCNRRTHDDIRDWKRLDSLDGYSATMNGDGTVPHQLGFLQQNGTRIPTWFVQEDHGALANNSQAIVATQLLLIQDKCDLPTSPPGARGLVADRDAARNAMLDDRTKLTAEEARLSVIVERLQLRTRTAQPADGAPASREEFEAENIVLRGFLGESTTAQTATPIRSRPPQSSKTTTRPKIEIALSLSDLEKFPHDSHGGPPVDAISVGHYVGVAPQNAERALDEAISGWKKGDSDDVLMLTTLHQRGAIAARLGQQFIVPDPRQPGRLAVLAGMGTPGGFGIPELTVAIRELVWVLGRIQRRHLASVLIGAGVGNLTVPLAVGAWMRGLRRALFDAQATGTPKIERLTFVENSPANFVRLHLALTAEAKRMSESLEPLTIEYLPPDAQELADATAGAETHAVNRARESIRLELSGTTAAKSARLSEPIRFTVKLTDKTYEFSVLSSDAAIPQRNTTVDPSLIETINSQLVIAPNNIRQRDLGHLLGRMLVPAELRGVVVKPGIPRPPGFTSSWRRCHPRQATTSSIRTPSSDWPRTSPGSCARRSRRYLSRRSWPDEPCASWSSPIPAMSPLCPARRRKERPSRNSLSNSPRQARMSKSCGSSAPAKPRASRCWTVSSISASISSITPGIAFLTSKILPDRAGSSVATKCSAPTS
jgi:pimeloyl-ACP methyl ester carboxylesterase